jgi:predicted ATP-dependent endonuclease of OLD family
MKITHVIIKNFRSIEEIEFKPRDLTTLIGPNNAGKSSVLRALEIFLNQQAPELDEWRSGHAGEPIVVEVEFSEVKEWERNQPGVSSHVFNGKVRIRATYSRTEDGKPKAQILWESYRQEETIEGWAEGAKFSELPDALKTLAKDNGIEVKGQFSKANQEKLRELVRQKLPASITLGEAKWNSDGFSIPAALQQALPQARLIPAVRSAEQDGEPGAKTSFGLLLKEIILPAVAEAKEYQDLRSAVTVLEKMLRGDGVEQLEVVRMLADDLKKRLSSLIVAQVSIGMEPPNTEKLIGDNTTLRLDDGTATRIGMQGHGLQRALIFAMLEVLASRNARVAVGNAGESQSRTTVLLFEEPELFIHPHLMRHLRSALESISGADTWQVLLTTHSPFLVDVARDPLSLVIHQRPQAKEPPTVRQLSKDPFEDDGAKDEREWLRAVLDFNPAVCEAFFARRAVLVEGDTEMAVLACQPELRKLAGVNVDAARDVTVVSCDGKWTIVPIARLLKLFGVPVRVIHDLDRKGKSDAQLQEDKSNEFHANKRISDIVGGEAVHAVDDTFEDLIWPAGTPVPSKDKPFRAWRRVKDLTAGHENLDHAAKLRAVVKFAFEL